MTHRAVLLDLDGTLVDSAPDIVDAANRMLRALRAPALAPDTIVGFIGNGVPTLVRRVLAASALAAADQALALGLFQRHYAATNGRRSRVYPGVTEGLIRLQAEGYRLACVTNKPQAAAAALLSLCGLAPYFAAVVGGDALAYLKPHPAPLLHACRLLRADPGLAVLVGDSHVDAAAARAAQMPAYIVRYGYPGPGGHAAIDDVTFIAALTELPALLRQNASGTCVPHSAPS